MKIIRYNQPTITDFSDFDRLFERAFSRLGGLFDDYGTAPATVGIPVNLYENDKSYQARFELPGFGKDAVQVEVKDGQLSVNAKQEAGEGEAHVTQNYKRTISLPKDARAEGISAKLENGVLYVELPKAEAPKPLQIEVK